MFSYFENGKRWYRVTINGEKHEFISRAWAWRAVAENAAVKREVARSE